VIHSLRLQQYRSYEDDSFEFDKSVNIIVGPNASGKTNLLEALTVVCQGKSYKALDGELVKHGTDWARIDTQADEHTRVVKLKADGKATTKRIEIDKNVYTRLSHQKQLPYVLFEPNDLRLLHGGPERRREYIDGLLERLHVSFGKARREYRRALAQRNRQLKSGHTKQDDLFVWDVRLSELGNTIAEQRQQLLRDISPKLSRLYREIAHSDVEVSLTYQTTCNDKNYGTSMLKLLKDNVSRDAERGFTGYGPHRDDIVITFDGYVAKEVASRGETRTVVLALKILELELLKEHKDMKPLLLLDDVFSELDGARRKHLTEYLQNHQTFITTTDADIVIQHFMKKCHIIPLG
jgi:DNA replication and repair protein RecF